MTHHDHTRNIHIKFATPEKRDKFLAKLAQAESERMKALAERGNMFSFKSKP